EVAGRLGLGSEHVDPAELAGTANACRHRRPFLVTVALVAFFSSVTVFLAAVLFLLGAAFLAVTCRRTLALLSSRKVSLPIERSVGCVDAASRAASEIAA